MKKTKLLSLLFLIFISSNLFSQTANAGDNREICTDTVYMNAQEPDVGYIGTWNVTSGSAIIDTPSSKNTFVHSIIEGITVLRWTITNGTITDYDSIIVTNNTPTQASVNSTDEICSSEYTLIGSMFDIDETGLWTLINGTGNITNRSSYNTEVTGLSLNNNSFKWVISKGICSTADTIIITNNEIYANANDDEIICNEYYTFNAINTGYQTAKWSVVASSGNPIIDNTSSNTSNVSNLAPNTNTFKWTVNKGICSDYDIIIITNNKTTVADAGDFKTSCETTYSLNGNNVAQGTGVWTVTYGSANVISPSEYNSDIENLQPETNSFKWTITKGDCSSFDEVDIFYNYIYVDAGDDDIICASSYQLNADVPILGTGVWSVVGGNGVFENSSINNTVVNTILQGENTYTWTITNGNCSASDNVIITNDSPSSANAGANQEICGSVTTMDANVPLIGSGVWSVINGNGIFDNSTAPNTQVTGISLGINIYRWTITNEQCPLSDGITVTNNFVTASAGDNQTICNDETTLSATPQIPGETGLWTIHSGYGAFTDDELATTQVTGVGYGSNTYKWTISKGICSASDLVTVNNKFFQSSCSVMGLSDICEDYAQISGNTPPSGASGDWSLMSGNGIFDNSNANITFVRNLDVGANVFMWTINNDGCTSSSTLTINRKTVFADAGDDQYVCEPSANLSANSQDAGVTTLWTLVSGAGNINDPTNNETSVTGLNPGINTFRWKVDGDGCIDEDDMLIINNQFFVSAGINKHVCETYTNLNGSNPTPGSGVWSLQTGTGSFSSPSHYQTEVNGMLSNTTNIYRWTVFKNGCYAFDDVTIYMDMAIAEAGDDQTVCESNAILTATEPIDGSGSWSLLDGGGTIATPNNFTTSVSGLANGANLFRWTTTNTSCISSDDVIINNNFVTVTAGNNIETCHDYTNLSGDEHQIDGYGYWSVVSGTANFDNYTLFNTHVTGLQQGNNVLAWTVFQNGCDNGGSEVNVLNKSFSAYAGEDQSLEDFVTATSFEADLPAGATGIWTVLAGAGNVLDRYSPTSDVIDMPTGQNTFRWQVDYNGCSEFDDVYIFVFNFTPNAGSDKTTCEDEIRMNAMSQNGNPEYWSVIEGQGTFSDINDASAWVTDMANGMNIYRWTVNLNGAISYDEVTIYKAYANAGEDIISCDNFAQLNANEVLYTWQGQWAVIGGGGTFNNPLIYNPYVTDIHAGLNTYIWTITTDDCSVSDNISITNNTVDAYAGTDQVVSYPYTYMNATLDENCSGEWSVTSGAGNIYDIVQPDTEVTEIGSGENIFRWTVTHLDCISYDEMSITRGNADIENLEFSKKINIYPNPSNGNFTVKFNNIIDNITINIYDLTGKIIFSNQYTGVKQANINIQEYNNGIYFINFKTDVIDYSTTINVFK